jgi:hypothetical protein
MNPSTVSYALRASERLILMDDEDEVLVIRGPAEVELRVRDHEQRRAHLSLVVDEEPA